MSWPNVTAVTLPVSASSGKAKGRKKRMKQVGSVEIPQEAFMAVLSAED